MIFNFIQVCIWKCLGHKIWALLWFWFSVVVYNTYRKSSFSDAARIDPIHLVPFCEIFCYDVIFSNMYFANMQITSKQMGAKNKTKISIVVPWKKSLKILTFVLYKFAIMICFKNWKERLIRGNPSVPFSRTICHIKRGLATLT